MKAAFLRFERRVTGLSTLGACVMLGLAACFGLVQIIMRFVLEEPSEWSEVLVRFALIWMVFLGIPAAFRIGSMVSVDLMHRKAPPVLQRALDGLIALATLCLLAVILWYGWDYAQRGKVQTIIGLDSFSMFWVYVAMPIGAVFAAVGVIGNFFDPRREELETAQ